MEKKNFSNDPSRTMDLDMKNQDNLTSGQTAGTYTGGVTATGAGVGGAPKDDMARRTDTSSYGSSTDTLRDESYRTEQKTTNVNTTGKDASVMTVLFNNPDNAESAYHELKQHGYREEDISVIMSDDTRKTHYADGDHNHKEDLGNKSLEGAGTGSAIGGTLGAIVGAIAAIGTSVVLPGIGLVVAGPLAAALAGAGAGGLAGGLIGALAGAGVPKEHAEAYEHGIKKGGILLSFRPNSRSDAEMFERKFRDLHGENIHY